jgi:hypothetical protein
VPGAASGIDHDGAVERGGDQAILAKRERVRRGGPSAPFLVLADAREVLADPSLLASYGAAFTAEDEVALVLFGPGLAPTQFTADLGDAAARAGFDLDSGPRLIALLASNPAPGEVAALGAEAYALLSASSPAAPFAHLAWLVPGSPAALRSLAARAWRARHRGPSDPTTAILRAAS